ncbi:hypothetical protein B0H11DRAFT_53660 [Mycena galericulata]|nr:hypothetical protein B0H11DRAFT_166617 [Mycena galericulata]KAJ7466729.1 hypothetical protein B0H11DRAFT_53660 [Mycena galericulata]
MSNSSPNPDLGAAEVQFEFNVNYYISITSFTILFYEYILTLDQEILAYWGTRITWPTLLFYLNRYTSLIGNVPIVFEYFWTANTPNKLQARCHALQTYHQYYAIVAQAFVAAMLIMRTYALYERNKKLLWLMVAVAVAAALVGAVLLFSGKGNSDDLNNRFVEVGCASGLILSTSRRLGFAWTGLLLFDCMIFVLTVSKAVVVSREQRGGLLFLLMRDGSLYFLVMVFSNCGNILSFIYAGPYERGVGTTFTNVISSVMISRLMLNLRDHKNMASMRTADSTTLWDQAPITTVLEPYYAQSTSGAYGSRGVDDTLTQDANDIHLEEWPRGRGEP